MKMERKYVVRRRVAFVIAVTTIGLVLGAISTNLWWTSDGYCWGDMFECMKVGE